MSLRRVIRAFPILCALTFSWGPFAHGVEKISLFNVIDLALKNHPEIVILRARAAQAQGRSAQAPSIPAPTLSVGTTGENGPFSSQGRMENSIEVAQTIPFPTKLAAEMRARNAEERIAEEALQAKTLAINAEVKGAFFDLYRAREQLELLAERRKVFLDHVKRVRASSLSDRLAQAHLMRVQTDAIVTQNEIEKARPDEIMARGRLNIAIGQDPGASVPALELPSLSDLPKDEATSGRVTVHHPVIRSLQASVEASEAESDHAYAAWLPDFRVQYRSNRRFDGVMPNNSEVMVGIDLPFLFFWRPRGEAIEARAKLEETRASLAKTESELKLETLKARAEAEALRSQILRFEREILPQSEKRLKIAHGIAPTDMESLDEHRNAMDSLIELKRTALDLRVNYEKAVAVWESLSIGQEVRR